MTDEALFDLALQCVSTPSLGAFEARDVLVDALIERGLIAPLGGRPSPGRATIGRALARHEAFEWAYSHTYDPAAAHAWRTAKVREEAAERARRPPSPAIFEAVFEDTFEAYDDSCTCAPYVQPDGTVTTLTISPGCVAHGALIRLT